MAANDEKGLDDDEVTQITLVSSGDNPERIDVNKEYAKMR